MSKSIPFFSLHRQWLHLKPRLQKAITQVCETQQFIGGPFVETFEKELANYLNIKHVIACNSGTDALWLALKALDITQEALVLTTPFSFIASCSEIIAHKAAPVFIDLDEETYTLSPQKLQAWLSLHAISKEGRTLHAATNRPITGIIAVNLFGQCADYAALQKIASNWNLWLIEDAAQSLGTSLHEKKAGTFGDIACFSFYPTKNLGACGDAGAVVTDNPILAQKIRLLQNHGRATNYSYMSYITYGINSRMDALQAAILTEKLQLLDTYNNKRRIIAERYREKLGHVKEITLPKVKHGIHTYHQFVITLPHIQCPRLRDLLRSYLTNHGIGSNIFYPRPLHHIDYIAAHSPLKTSCPIAERFSHTIVALPIWPELHEEEIDYICNHISSFVTQYATTVAQKTKNPQKNVMGGR